MSALPREVGVTIEAEEGVWSDHALDEAERARKALEILKRAQAA